MSASAFARTVDVFAAQNLSPAALSARLAETAREDVARLIASGRASPRYRRFVDGVEGAPETAVKPDGMILYRFDYMAEVAAFVLSFLEARAPKRTGEFSKSFYLGLDGKFVPARFFNPATMGDVREIACGNMQPQARIADTQMVGTKRVRFSVPPGMFEDAAQAVRSRFGNIVTAKRVYTLRWPGQYTLRTGKRAGKPVESPAVVITRR